MSTENLSIVIAILSIAVAIVAAAFAYVQSRAAKVSVLLTQRDLSLTAYANAIQELLDLKKSFSVQPGVFKEQIKLADIGFAIPNSMKDNIDTFLLFAGGMWRFSYIYSIMSRWRELGLTRDERDGLENEMLLWLRGLPGFYEVYQTHTSRFRAHNRSFLEFLEKRVYNDEFKVYFQRATKNGELVEKTPSLYQRPSHLVEEVRESYGEPSSKFPSTEIPEPYSNSSSKPSSNVFTISIIIGVVCLAITSSLPGGLDGNAGFIIGFSVSFLLLSLGLFASENRSSEANTPIKKEQ